MISSAVCRFLPMSPPLLCDQAGTRPGPQLQGEQVPCHSARGRRSRDESERRRAEAASRASPRQRLQTMVTSTSS